MVDIRCPECGALLKNNHIECWKCGVPLVETQSRQIVDSEKMFDSGLKYLEEKRWNDAIKAFQSCIDARYEKDSSIFNLGICYYNKDEYKKAIDCFIEYSEKDDAECNQMLAYSYHFIRDYKKAWGYHRKAIKNDPSLKDEMSNMFPEVTVQCPRCRNQYEIYDLKNTKKTIEVTCKHCGWKREYIDDELTKPGIEFYWGGNPKGMLIHKDSKDFFAQDIIWAVNSKSAPDWPDLQNRMLFGGGCYLGFEVEVCQPISRSQDLDIIWTEIRRAC